MNKKIYQMKHHKKTTTQFMFQICGVKSKAEIRSKEDRSLSLRCFRRRDDIANRTKKMPSPVKRTKVKSRSIGKELKMRRG